MADAPRTLPGMGQMPRPAGSVIAADRQGNQVAMSRPAAPGRPGIRPTESERAGLRSLGLDPDEPMPPGLAEALSRVQADLQAVPSMTPVAPDTPPLVVDEVDISRLPPEQQARMRAAARDILERHRRMEELGTLEGINPGVADAIRAAEARDVPLVVDDRKSDTRVSDPGPRLDNPWRKRPAPDTQIGPGTEPGRPSVAAADPAPLGPQGSGPYYPRSIDAEIARRQEAEAKAAGLEQQLAVVQGQLTDLQAERSSSGLGEVPRICPRCGYDKAGLPDPEPTPDQARDYLAMILGGPFARFRHAVDLFGGKVRVTFRNLTYEESELVLRQMGLDVRAGKVGGEGEWLKRAMDYRLAATIESVEYAGTGKVAVPPMAQFPERTAAEPKTVLVDMLAYLRSDVLPSESVRRAAGLAFAQFQRLVEKLEANAENPDFWKGIGAQP